MTRFLSIGTLITVFSVGTVSLAQAPARSDTLIWGGTSGGFTLRWTSVDITASPINDPSRIIFSAKQMAREKFAAFKKENLEDDAAWRCSFELRFRLLSVVGSLLSYEEAEDAYCGRLNGVGWNHPSVQISYRVIDLNQASVPVSLAKFFSDALVLEALLGDSLVKAALKEAGNPSPKTPMDLVTAINAGTDIKPLRATAEAPKGCGFLFPEHPFTEFAFHHIEKGQVAVRLSLVPSSGACHSAHSQLGLLLPIPESLQPALISAQSRAQGFLMTSSVQLSKGKVTTFSFETKPSKEDRKR